MVAMPNVAPVIVGAKVDPTLKQQLVEQARRNERNVSQEIRLALRRHVGADGRATAS